ncbi:hypothetical protein B566_EDAN010174, partial [Ephemera danica]
MRVGYVPVHNVPSRVVTCGGWLDEAFAQRGQNKEMVFIIPGNPGLTGYYEEFVQYLYDQVNMPTWILCHAGHEIEPSSKVPSVKDFPHLYDLPGQIAHKVEFINKYIPTDVKIHLIGHSVGCYIILNMLKNKLIDHEICMSYMLFPAVERIGISPNGKVFNFFEKYFLWLILFASAFFSILPKVIGKALVSAYFLLEGTLLKNVRTTMHLINPVILRHIFFLAADEMKNITDLDSDTIMAHKSKLLFYYGKKDGWCPLQYYHDMKQRLPEINAVTSTTDMRHAFVLNSSKEMASHLGKWITT